MIEITKQEAPHIIVAIVCCLGETIHLDPETEEVLVDVYDRITQALGGGVE